MVDRAAGERRLQPTQRLGGLRVKNGAVVTTMSDVVTTNANVVTTPLPATVAAHPPRAW